MGPSCVVIVPVLRRPHKAGPLVASLASSRQDARVLFVASPDDPGEVEACRATGAETLVVDWPGGSPGDYARKVNAGWRASSEPLMLFGADDIVFHAGWLDEASRVVGGGAAVVGTNDLGSERVMRGVHATHPLVSRDYVDSYGTIDGEGALHEGYHHNFVDDELVATAKHRGVWGAAVMSHVEHLHPDWGRADRDEVYDIGRSGWLHDKYLFRRRSPLWT